MGKPLLRAIADWKAEAGLAEPYEPAPPSATFDQVKTSILSMIISLMPHIVGDNQDKKMIIATIAERIDELKGKS